MLASVTHAQDNVLAFHVPPEAVPAAAPAASARFAATLPSSAFVLQLRLRSLASSGVLFAVQDMQIHAGGVVADHVSLQLVDSTLVASVGAAGVIAFAALAQPSQRIESSAEHTVELEWDGAQGELSVLLDGTDRATARLPDTVPRPVALSLEDSIYLGAVGHGGDADAAVVARSYLLGQAPFYGCLRDASVNGMVLALDGAAEAGVAVTDTCAPLSSTPVVCAADTCSGAGTCTEGGLLGAVCLCEPGVFGAACSESECAGGWAWRVHCVMVFDLNLRLSI